MISNLFAFLALRPRILSDGNGRPAPETLRHGIEFEHVNFRYPGASEDWMIDGNQTSEVSKTSEV